MTWSRKALNALAAAMFACGCHDTRKPALERDNPCPGGKCEPTQPPRIDAPHAPEKLL